MRDVFSGADLIGGGVPTSSDGDPSACIDGDPATTTNFPFLVGGITHNGWWNYEFPAPVAIREVALRYLDSDYYHGIDIQAWDGFAWISALSFTGLVFQPGVIKTLSMYEIVVQGGFAGGEPPVNISLEDTATQEVVGGYAPDPSGTTSILLPSAGPYDVAIERAGHRTLVSANHLASEA